MPYNYLPFARRVYLNFAAGQRITVPRESFSVGFGRRAFLSDLSIDFFVRTRADEYDYTWDNARIGTENCLMRLGVFGRPYMTEEFYPVALFGNRHVDEMGVWRFPKPYTIFPGERLKARVIYSPGGAVQPLPSVAYNGYWATRPSIAFFGIKKNTNHPCVLYDQYPATFNPADGTFVDPALGTPVLLQGEQLQCPQDSSVDIYAVKDSMGDALGNSPHATQVFSPDGRKWWENDNWPMMLRPTFVIKDLNSPEWILNPDETLQLEMINPASLVFANSVVITLRGQAEVAV